MIRQFWGSIQDASGGKDGYVGSIGAGGKLDFYFYKNNNLEPEVSTQTGTVPTNQWSHVAYCLNNQGGVSLYVNGFLQATGAFSQVPNQHDRALMLGRSIWSQTYMNYAGKIDDVRIYNRALSSSEIQTLYLSDSGGVQPQITQITPINQTVLVGSNATFTVSATGTAPLYYQWLRGSISISGATNSSFIIYNSSLPNTGSYFCLVSNAYGSVTSAAATLTVSNLPPHTRFVRLMDASGAAGSLVTVPILLAAQGNENSLGLSLNFDPAVLSYRAISNGNNAASAMIFVNTNQIANGRLGFQLGLPAGSSFASGTQQVALVTFALVGNATPGTSVLSFGDVPVVREIVDAAAAPLPASYIGGVVMIVTGYEADVAPRPNGNNNGQITTADWVQVGRFAAGLDTAAVGSEFQRADCAPRATLGDGRITTADWVQAGRYAAGLDPVTAAGGSTGTAITKAVQLAKTASASVVQLRGQTVIPGGTTYLPVQLLAAGNENGLGFSLAFDTNVLRFASASNAIGGGQLILNTNAAAAGKLGFQIALSAGATFPAGTQTVAWVGFTALQANTTSAVSFADQPVTREVVDATATPIAANYQDASVIVSAPATRPAIVQQPISVAVRPGQTAQLQVSAVGSSPLSYRWTKNGVTVPGANAAVYTVNNVSAANAGKYQVIITNAVDSITSAVAVLTVDVAKPVVVITAPLPNAKVYRATTNLLGRVTDAGGSLQGVYYQVNNDLWQTASGTTNWQASITLVPNTNTIRVYAADMAGNVSLTNTLKVNYVVSERLEVTVTGSGSVMESNKLFVSGQRVLGKTVTLTAKPTAGNILSSWVVQKNGINVIMPFKHDYNTLTFTMEADLSVTANFVPNPFLAYSGEYGGLFLPPVDTNGVRVVPTDWTNSGIVSLTLTTNGTFSGQLTYKGMSYPMAGELDARGSNVISVARGKEAPLYAMLQLAPDAAEIIGTISLGTTWSSELSAYRKMITKNTELKGNYTVGIQNGPDGGTGGALTVAIAPQGAVTLSGSLADGTAIMQSRWLTTNGDFLVYQSLYGNKGMLLGWAHCDFDGHGELFWQKPAVPTDKLYKNGFTVSPGAMVHRFTAPTLGGNATFWTNNVGSLSVWGGGMTNDLWGQLRVVKSVGTPYGTNNPMKSYGVTFDVTKGTFAGSFTNPDNKKVTAFKGVVLQFYNTNNLPIGSECMGWFLGVTNSGSVKINGQ